MTFELVHIFLAVLFTAGIVVLFWALREEAREQAPFYLKLSTIAAMLMIAATFMAVLIS